MEMGIGEPTRPETETANQTASERRKLLNPRQVASERHAAWGYHDNRNKASERRHLTIKDQPFRGANILKEEPGVKERSDIPPGWLGSREFVAARLYNEVCAVAPRQFFFGLVI